MINWFFFSDESFFSFFKIRSTTAHFCVKPRFWNLDPICSLTVDRAPSHPITYLETTSLISFLRSRNSSSDKKFGIIGHSLGGIATLNVSNDDFITTFNAVYMYDDKYGFFGGTGGFLFFTNDGGNSIYRILGGVINDINCIVACKVDNDNIKLVIGMSSNENTDNNKVIDNILTNIPEIIFIL